MNSLCVPSIQVLLHMLSWSLGKDTRLIMYWIFIHNALSLLSSLGSLTVLSDINIRYFLLIAVWMKIIFIFFWFMKFVSSDLKWINCWYHTIIFNPLLVSLFCLENILFKVQVSYVTILVHYRTYIYRYSFTCSFEYLSLLSQHQSCSDTTCRLGV